MHDLPQVSFLHQYTIPMISITKVAYYKFVAVYKHSERSEVSVDFLTRKVLIVKHTQLF